MNLSRALSYAFDDAQWAAKLAMVAVLYFAMVVFMPALFLGLVPMCVLLGYSLEIIENVRQKADYPLPRWDNFNAYLSRGAGMLPALFLYHLPLILLLCCATVIRLSFGDLFIGGFALVVIFCCMTPLLLIYTAYTWPMLANATAKYARGQPPNVFYEVGKLSDAVNEVFSESMQLVFAFFLVNIGFTLVQVIPVLGQLLLFALYIPAIAHLTGQYARIMDVKDPHRKRR